MVLEPASQRKPKGSGHINVAGYVKLAKLWERNREEAIQLQHEYYADLMERHPEYYLVDVYVDITGNKEIRKRREMVRLLGDCVSGKIDLIYSQTKAYLAANTKEFCFFLKFLLGLEKRVDLITEDSNYNINTIIDKDNQREELFKMADKYCNLNPADYNKWEEQMHKLIGEGTDGNYD